MSKGKHKKTSHRSKKGHTNAKQIDEGLEAIYGEKTTVDFTKLERKKRDLTSLLLRTVLFLGIIATLAWTSFFIYQKFFQNETNDILTLSIEHEGEIASGSTSEFTVVYRNEAKAPLANLDIDINFPKGFLPQSFSKEATNKEEYIWSIGSIPGQSDGIITFEGVWIGSVPSTQSIQAFASYKPSNFNADFQTIETIQIQSIHSIVETSIEGPEELSPGEIGTYTITINNPSVFNTPPLEIDLDIPDGFSIDSSSPALESGTAPIFYHEGLAEGEEFTVTIHGSFASEIEGFEYLTANTYFTNANDRYLQSEEQHFTDVLTSALQVQIVANGSDAQASAMLGDDLRITLAIHNTGITDIESVTALLDFQTPEDGRMPLHWSGSDYDGGTLTSDGVYWSESAIGTIAAGEKKIYNLRFPIHDSLAQQDADKLTVIAHIDHGQGTIRSKLIPITITSELSLNAHMRYFDDTGSAVGFGPLPPMVGKETAYEFVWTIGNSMHDLEDIRLETTLSPDAVWKNSTQASIGSLTYNETTRELAWTIDFLPANSGLQTSYVLTSITPNEQMTNSFVRLFSESLLTALNLETNTFLQTSAESTNTDLKQDPHNTENGIVSPAE